MTDLAPDLADIISPLVTLRRDIHAHPELGFKEHRTAARIAADLSAALGRAREPLKTAL